MVYHAHMRVMLEIGPKGRKVVAWARDWPGFERGARTSDAAFDRLVAYLPRYAAVAKLAGMEAEFAADTHTREIVEQYPGTGSTDFWGISFAFSAVDRQDISGRELARDLTLMQACWAFFDQVRLRVSAELERGPRGGGRQRDDIVRHVVRTEQEWAKKLQVVTGAAVMQSEEALIEQRDAFCAAIRDYHAEGKMARTWPLRYLVRHTAYHALDHAWEMEDKDLSSRSAQSGPVEGGLK